MLLKAVSSRSTFLSMIFFKSVSFPFHNSRSARVWNWGSLIEVTVDKLLSFSHTSVGLKYLSSHWIYSTTLINLKYRDILFLLNFQSATLHDTFWVNRKNQFIILMKCQENQVLRKQWLCFPFLASSSLHGLLELAWFPWGERALHNC